MNAQDRVDLGQISHVGSALALHQLKFGVTYYSAHLEGRFRLQEPGRRLLERFSPLFKLWLPYDERVPYELPLFHPEA